MTAFNNGWQFSRNKDFSDAQEVRLPHANATLPFNYTDEKDYQFVSFYRKTFVADESMLSKSVLLTFDGAAHCATLVVNGEVASKHKCGYTPWTTDVAPFLRVGDNEIRVELDSRETLDTPPFGFVIDYLTYGGLYREARIEIKEKSYLKNLFAAGYAETENFNFECSVEVVRAKADMTLNYYVSDGEKEIFSCVQKVDEQPLYAKIDGVSLWDVDSPKLYTAGVILLKKGEEIDRLTAQIGFRTVFWCKTGFYLNGKKVKLRGLNRHQSYPYVGYAMPARQQISDAEFLKNDLGVNAVRTSHYPQSEHFLSACDRLGLLVFEEIPGWQHIGGEQWKNQAVENVKDMILAHRNHPSIILWGVRINESQDDDEFYTRTNEVAHDLDWTRPTSGVRYIRNSSLLEDVYAFNDFNERGERPSTIKKRKVTKTQKGYFVSEFNGHMYPTKSFDDEAHRLAHAIKHASMVNGYTGDDDLAGGFGWCMADYNTHTEFGAGDKICYHGVSDMFRNKKLAGEFYSSQGDEPMLAVTSTMDKGDWEASFQKANVIFTNCDSVRLYKNGEFVSEAFPDKKHFPALKHAPVVVDDLVGDTLITKYKFKPKSSRDAKALMSYVLQNGFDHIPLGLALKMLGVMSREKKSFAQLYAIAADCLMLWGSAGCEFRFDGIKDGKVAKSVTCAAVSGATLDLKTDSTTLFDGDTYDVSEVKIRAVDQFGNLLPYCQDAFTAEASGDVEIIGDSPFSLRGGTFGVYVKTLRKGKGTLTINHRGKVYTVNYVIK